MSNSFDDATVDGLIAAAEGNPRAMINLARTLLIPMKKEMLAREICARALAIGGDAPELTAMARMVDHNNVKPFYFSMVKDENRHSLYTDAFRKLIKPGAAVLDIGAGTGLFAMMAAREGAGCVTACESVPAVAEAASRVVEKNDLSKIVNLVAKKSYDLEIGVDMEERADVLIWDNLANNLLGVGAPETLKDARQRLLKPDAIIIPGRVEVCAALVENKRSAESAISDVDGFDLSPFNSLLERVVTISHGFQLRSEPVTLFDFDFQSGEKVETKASRQTAKVQPGPVNGIVQWLRFHLAEGVVYDTSGEDVYAFGQKFHPVMPFTPTGSQDVQICGSHDGNIIWLWMEGG